MTCFFLCQCITLSDKENSILFWSWTIMLFLIILSEMIALHIAFKKIETTFLGKISFLTSEHKTTKNNKFLQLLNNPDALSLNPIAIPSAKSTYCDRQIRQWTSFRSNPYQEVDHCIVLSAITCLASSASWFLRLLPFNDYKNF